MTAFFLFALFAASAGLPLFNKCVSHNPSAKGKRFDAFEHMFLGESVCLQFPSGCVAGAELNFRGAGKRTYSYGTLLALGGDFFGASWDSEVVCLGDSLSERVRRAHVIFDKFRLDTSAFPEAAAELVSAQCFVAQSFSAAGLDTSLAKDHMSEGMISWENEQTGLVLRHNWDHFGNVSMAARCADVRWCNRLAYTAFNTLAQSFACGSHRAGQSCSVAGNVEDLRTAYAVLAFAHHFLTDAFAGGHQRVPRFQDSFPCRVTLTSELLINCEHNVDNMNGVWASVGGQAHLLRGDGSLAEQRAETALILNALKTGIAEVHRAFQSRRVGAVETERIFPRPLPDAKQAVCPRYTVNDQNKIAIQTSAVPQEGKCSFRTMTRDDCSDWPHVPPLRFDAEVGAYVGFPGSQSNAFYLTQNMEKLVVASVKAGRASLVVRVLATTLECGSSACCEWLGHYAQRVFAVLPEQSKRAVQNHPSTVTNTLKRHHCISDETKRLLLPPTEICKMDNVIGAYGVLAERVNAPSKLKVILDSQGQFIDASRVVCAEYVSSEKSTVQGLIDKADCNLSRVKALIGQVVRQFNRQVSAESRDTNGHNDVLVDVFSGGEPRLIVDQGVASTFVLSSVLTPLLQATQSEKKQAMVIQQPFMSVVEAHIVQSWKEKGVCPHVAGMNASVGKNSPFLSGRAVQVKELSRWRASLSQSGFSFASGDVAVYTANNAAVRDASVSRAVLAFAHLHNEYNPASKLPLDGEWSPAFVQAVLDAPLGGYKVAPTDQQTLSPSGPGSCSRSRVLEQVLSSHVAGRSMEQVAEWLNGKSSSNQLAVDPRCKQRLPSSSVSIPLVYRCLRELGLEAREPKWPTLAHCDANSTGHIARADFLRDFLSEELSAPVAVHAASELPPASAVVVFAACPAVGPYAAGHANVWTGARFLLPLEERGFFANCVANLFFVCTSSE